MSAVGDERISTVVGYLITKGDFSETTPNLPQRVAIIAQANTANQSGLITTGKQITTAQQAGQLYGYGSPIHRIMSILRPQNGGIGGIPTYVYAQAAAVGATAKKITMTPTGTATGNGTHTLVIAGRQGIGAQFYDITVNQGDTADDLTQKYADAVNNVLGAPVTAADTQYDVAFETKWKDATANELTISVETYDKPLGITYNFADTTAGSGVPSIAAALTELDGTAWTTILLNGYGTNTTIMSALEAFNGIPLESNPTGRYAGLTWKPLIAITGSTAEDPSNITDTRLDDVTIAIAPAPLSAGFSFEAAANMTVLFARQAQDTPHLDVQDMVYPDMPAPLSIGAMAIYDNRDAIVKKGCSTVDLVNGKYVIKDFVTTYHPVGESPAQYRYCSNLNLDWNVRFGYLLLEQANVVGHVIAKDTDTVSATKVVKPKMWKGVLFSYATALASRGLIVDAPFMQRSITVSLGTNNPDKLNTFFRYKRRSFARISDTTAEAGYNFGTLNA